MPPVARFRDICTGHECWPPRPNIMGSPNVFVNKRQAHRLGDMWAYHCCGPDCHDSSTAEGSKTVYVNGIPLSRIGDAVACGSAIMTGSSNVSAG